MIDCQDCFLCLTRKNVVKASGENNYPIMFVAEAPGKYEDNTGIPFVGKSGVEFDYMLARYGLNRYDVIVTNLVKCRPPGNADPTKEQIQACSKYLEEEIRRYKPKYIASLGRISSHYLTGLDLPMQMIHGLCYPKYNDNNITIIPCYHPASGLHQLTNLMHTNDDLKYACQVVLGNKKLHFVTDGYPDPDYRECRDIDELKDYIGNSHIIAIDTEWARGKPWCLSISVKHGTALVVMADQVEVLQTLHEYVSKDNITSLIHNALYDVPVLSKMGIEPANIHDTMIMAYLLQNEPQGLKPLAYRHAGIRMNSYKHMVKGATRQHAFQYLIEAQQLKFPDPEHIPYKDKDGNDKVKKPQNVSTKITRILNDSIFKDANPYKRWFNIKPESGRSIVEDVCGVMQEGELCDVDYADMVYYSGQDADATIRIYPYLLSKIKKHDKLFDTFLIDMGILPMIIDMMKVGIKLDINQCDKIGEYLDNKKLEIIDTISEISGSVINLGSSQQVANLLYKQLKLKVLRKTKSGSPSTDDKALSLLKDKHKVVEMIRQWRQYNKLQTSYIDTFPKMVDEDDRIHCQILVTRTSTGRLATKKPNLMAIPTRSKEGKEFKKALVAKKGCRLVACDYSQVELRIAAHMGQDKNMTEIFESGLDVHTATAAKMFNIPINKVDKNLHRRPAKTTNFGIIYGISASGLYKTMTMNRATGWSVPKCAELIELWFQAFPGIANYMQKTATFAKQNGYVVDMWGRIRKVPSVQLQDEYLRAEGLRQAGNATIQSGAQGIMKIAMGRLIPVYKEWQQMDYDFNPLIQIHDDILWEVNKKIIDVVLPIIKETMESVGDYLSVPLIADPEVGKRWGEMVKWEG